MLSGHMITKALQDLHHITRTELLASTASGEIIADFSSGLSGQLSALPSFMESSATTMSIGDTIFFKVYDEEHPVIILLASGDHASAIGRIAVSELENMLTVSHEKTDKNHFIHNILLDNLMTSDITISAKRMKIRDDTPRTVYLIETEEDTMDVAFQTLKALYSTAGSGVFLSTIDPSHIAITTETDPHASAHSLEKTARTLADMLNMEAMISVRIAYGSPKETLQHLSQSYKEAQMAMEVGEIFFPDRYIISYSNLGIGRLIYHLPTSLCELFMSEVFDHDVFSELDEETMTTIRIFFANNLNISETARQLYLHRNTLVYRMEKLEKTCGLDIRKFDDAMTFRIAMMIHDYLLHNS